MISAVTNQGRLNFMIFKQRFTEPVFLGFVARLIRQPSPRGRKVFLIVEGQPAHKHAAAHAWLGARRDTSSANTSRRSTTVRESTKPWDT
ncbi:MAG: hypothetical protein K8S99_09050 [Planctomycetes bacterium]|nr:hypothetical protein [Planctomycetota bacterium]